MIHDYDERAGDNRPKHDPMFTGFYEQNARRRQQSGIQRSSEPGEVGTIYENPDTEAKNNQWKRILLLVVAITVSVL